MSKFWEHYEAAKPHIASAVDDVRHKVVEEGWFSRTQGRAVTGGIDVTPSATAETVDPAKDETAKATHNHSALYTEVWGKEPAAADIYGHTPASGQTADIKVEQAQPSQKDAGLEPDL